MKKISALLILIYSFTCLEFNLPREKVIDIMGKAGLVPAG